MIDGLSINKFIFVIFLLFNLIDSALPSYLDTVVMLPDEELYDSIKKLFLSSFDRLLMFDDLKDFPLIEYENILNNFLKSIVN